MVTSEASACIALPTIWWVSTHRPSSSPPRGPEEPEEESDPQPARTTRASIASSARVPVISLRRDTAHLLSGADPTRAPYAAGAGSRGGGSSRTAATRHGASSGPSSARVQVPSKRVVRSRVPATTSSVLRSST